jgi:hypothetical protein
MDLEFDRQQATLDERYQRRWAVTPSRATARQDMSPSCYSLVGLRQQPTAITPSPAPAVQDASFDFSGPPQMPTTSTALDELLYLPVSPRTPALVDPASLTANVEVRFSSVSPSAVEREDPGLNDSGIGMCNNELPCDKDFVCDYHKFFHTPAA